MSHDAHTAPQALAGPDPRNAREALRGLLAWLRVNVGLSRGEVLGLTPGETIEHIEAWRRRERIEDRRVGRICAIVANCHRDAKKMPLPFHEGHFVPGFAPDRPDTESEIIPADGDALSAWAEARAVDE